ncbi:MAG: DEAD/DEAH box helicase [Clostridium sp.]|uniref:DEAD/DEAH box helicase n=1 Tax=Clostridium sp. TaxID=1506 RepID=UPI0039E92631
MSMNPVKTTKYINSKYTEYLKSILTVKDNVIREKAISKIKKENKFIKGPFIEITPPFQTGKSIKELIDEGILSIEFKEINKSLDNDRSLYKHQEVAIRKIVNDSKNLIVATGTGSGKTECFLIPIVNYLMKQKENGTLNSGVRALLLYPMNALANDQVKRLRSLLKDYPDITFGRYTGETSESTAKALQDYRAQNNGEDPISNELISREQMRKNPPHFLLTNYAMLEYLLLRPKDNDFFDGEYSDEWKFIVLDEAHSYKGANGAEVSLLLKRFKERINGSEEGKIQCIATSATLGGGKEDYPKVAQFASDLFSEKFYPEDIVESSRVNIASRVNPSVYRNHNFYNNLKDDYYLFMEGKKTLGELKNEYKINYDTDDIYRVLYEILKDDENLLILQKELGQGTESIDKVVDIVFKKDTVDYKKKEDALISLVDISSKAKKDENSKALLPARYHLFVRALEGMYASFYPNKEVYLERREKIKVANNSEVTVFELANCQKCGQEYIVGTIDKLGYLKHYTTDFEDSSKTIVYFMIDNSQEDIDSIDEDEGIIFDADNSKAEDWILCSVCGKLEKAGKDSGFSCCNVNDNKKYIKVKRILKKSHSLNSCMACGGVSPNIVKRFLTSYDPATNVLARSLYEMVPSSTMQTKIEFVDDSSENVEDDWFIDEDSFDEVSSTLASNRCKEEKKLLVFSDNRQEAAFFGAYMDNRYNQLLWRKILLRSLEELKLICDDDIRVDGLATRMVKLAVDAGVFDETFSLEDKKRIAYGCIIKELIAIERNTGLEGLGLIKIAPVKIGLNKSKEYKPLNINAEELETLINIILDSFRFSSCISYPSSISPLDEIFAPRNRNVYFRTEGAENGKNVSILGALPSENTENKRSNFIKKVLIKNGVSQEEARNQSKEILKNILNLFEKHLISRLYVEIANIDKFGIVKRLNYKMWNISLASSEDNLYICNKCGKVTSNNIKNICPEFRCDGELIELNNRQTSKYDYYRDLYSDKRIIPMVAKEHTAQLTSTAASELQKKFESGKVNVLSCSTTFEMGVDVGQLEAIFMRNVPPETANYIQRAGRAGRRGASTAFVLTFARRRSHDLNYYNNPTKIIHGSIQAPYIEIKNEKIIKRHINSVIFAYFFRCNPELFRNTEDFFILSEDMYATKKVKELLESHPKDLISSLKKIVPNSLHKKLGLDDWSFIDELCGEDGSFTKIEIEYRNNLKELDTIKQEKFEKGQNTDYINRIMNTYKKKSNINYLSDRNILPKYGFPVDVVSLDILNDSADAKNVDLSRDLKVAITEFAPGSSLVANGKLWTSYSINIATNKGWPTYEYAICTKCKKIYTVQSDLGNTERYINSICECGNELQRRFFIKPQFGFSTCLEAPKTPGENRPSKFYATNITFDDFEKLDKYQEREVITDTIDLNEYKVLYRYSPMGRFVLVNKGIGNLGFRVCKLCGYATAEPQDKKTKFTHKNKFGSTCASTNFYMTDLGHEFTTDVLQITLPPIGELSENLWITLLYSIIEGACETFDIVRSDINGCLYYNNNNYMYPSIILFDEVAGGAGHVKKISTNIKEVLKSAYDKVSNCECGEETSCYGCLRNYNNQLFHEKIQRGLAKEYLGTLLNR